MRDGSGPDLGRTRAGIILFLAGPVIWYGYFWLVYMVAEAACTRGGLAFRGFGLNGVSLVTVALSLLSIVASAALAVMAYRLWARREENDSPGPDTHLLYWGGAALGALFTLAIALVGLPAIVLVPC
jgi:heme/copper-type cytochrome/quinol oxidase subunit 3